MVYLETKNVQVPIVFSIIFLLNFIPQAYTHCKNARFVKRLFKDVIYNFFYYTLFLCCHWHIWIMSLLFLYTLTVCSA